MNMKIPRLTRVVIGCLSVGFTLILSLTAQAASHGVTVVNDDATPVLRIVATPTQGGSSVVLDTAGPLQGGRAAAVAWPVENETCIYDLAVTYADRPPLRITHWDICQDPRLSIGEAWRRGQRAIQAGSRPSMPL